MCQSTPAESAAAEGQGEAPGPRTEKSIDVKSSPGHASNSRGQRDEGAHHRQQPRDEDGDAAEPVEEPVGTANQYTFAPLWISDGDYAMSLVAGGFAFPTLDKQHRGTSTTFVPLVTTATTVKFPGS